MAPGLLRLLDPYLRALHAFTRLPVGEFARNHLDAPAGAKDAVLIQLPGVGWLVALAACLAISVFGIVLPSNVYAPLAASIGCVAGTLMIFGARNEESLATMPRAWRLASPEAFQSESLTIHFAILAKVALLAVLAAHSPVTVLCALFAGHVLSRFWPLVLPRALPFIGNSEREGLVAIDNRAIAKAAAWCVLPLVIAGWARGPAFALSGLIVSGMTIALMAWLCRERQQGFTRESFDAAQPCCEIAFYLGAAAGLATA